MPKHGDGVTMQNSRIPYASIFIRQYHEMNAQMTNGMIGKKNILDSFNPVGSFNKKHL